MDKMIGLLLLATALLSAAQAAAQAEPLHPYLGWRHYFSFGVYEQKMHAEVSETRGPIPTLSVNLDHLDVDDEHTDISLAYMYRLSERWALMAAANRFSGDGKIGRSRSFGFGPLDFPFGVGVKTEIELDTYALDFLYSTYRSSRAELAIGAGLHAFDFYGHISAYGQAVRNVAEESLEVDDFAAPLPNLRLQGFYAFSPRLAVYGALGWLSLDIDEWDGDFLYWKADISYRLSDGLNLSLGYQVTDIDVTRKQRQPRRRSGYDLEYSGPSIHLSYGF